MKTLLKKFSAFLLILSFIGPMFYLPAQAPRAEAQGLPTMDIKQIVLDILNGIAMTIAQKMVDDMVKSTVQWAQTGFEGNPAYVTDPAQFFTDIADQEAGRFIEGRDLGFLCSPFQAQIRLSLAQQYYAPTPYSCTLTTIDGNLDAFFSNFSEGGGWETWFSMTQNPSNNAYGAFLQAKIDLDSRVAKAIGLENKKLDWSQGFLSWSECLEHETIYSGSIGINTQVNQEKGKCIKRGPTQTPGTTIKAQLDKVLPSGMERLISAQHIEQLVSAFATGLLNRYVFSDKGIFGGATTKASSREIIDVDDDGIPDGWDYDDNGQLDICHHGTNDHTKPPSNTNCIGSKGVASSPYFIPICEDLSATIRELEEYKEFADRNDFSKVYANTWMNKTMEVTGAVDQLVSTIGRYEIMEYDVALFALGKYQRELDKRNESLAKDGDLHTLFEGSGDAVTQLRRNTTNILSYLKQFQSAMGRCDNPNAAAIGQIPPPDLGGEGNQCLAAGEQYAGVLRDAMDQVLSERPDIASLPNIEEGNRENARAFLALVETKLISMGYQAADDVLNGNGNPSTGDIIGVWKSGDNSMERYDAIIGGAPTIREAATTQFTGFIPLDCTSTGGGNDCACQDGDGGGGTGELPNQPASLLGDLQTERAKYGTPMTDAEVGKLLNAVAWKNRNTGWGLLGKEGGANCPAPGGQRISCDYLIHQDTYYGYDVLIDTEGVGTPSWQGPEDLRSSINNGSRTFVTPIAPQ